MPDMRRARCQACGKSRADAGGISWSGLCHECAVETMSDNIESIATGQGYPYLRWQRGMIRWAMALTLDGSPASPHTTP